MKLSTNKISLNAIIIYLQENTFLNTKEIYKIVSHIYNISNNEILLMGNELYEFSNDTFKKIQKYYLKSHPLEYVSGVCYFLNKAFKIEKPILIPRSETEQLTISAIKKIQELKINMNNALEIGVGSGVIIHHLAMQFPKCKFQGIDKHKKSILISKKNNWLQKNVDIQQISFEKFMKNPNNIKYDFIISNPPYIAYNEISCVSKSTLLHEKKSALFAKKKWVIFLQIIF